MTATKLRRIAALHRELAEAYDDLADETPVPVRRIPRERTDRAAEDAVRRVQDAARKRGIKVA